eukprot:3002356-Rhodomonas_salina.1
MPKASAHRGGFRRRRGLGAGRRCHVSEVPGQGGGTELCSSACLRLTGGGDGEEDGEEPQRWGGGRGD